MPDAHSEQPASIPQLRAVTLASFVDLVTELGADPYALLRRAKIVPESLKDPEFRLAAGTVIGLMEDTAAATGCPALGLLLAERRSFPSVGPVSLLLEHQPHVRQTVESIIRYYRLFSDVIQPHLDDDGETALIRLEMLSGKGSRQIIECAVAMMHRTLNAAAGGRWRPDVVHFRHSAPGDLHIHQRVFQRRVEFDSDFDGMSCLSSSLDMANPGGDEMMAHHAERFVAMLESERPAMPFGEQVRQAINSVLSRGHPAMDAVAHNLGLGPRKLQRMLEKEGTTFAALLNETRRGLALRYLAESGLSVTRVALLLGYSSTSSFSRWFTVEFGQSPLTWRSSGAGRATVG